MKSLVERKIALSVSSVLVPLSEESELSESNVVLNSCPRATILYAFLQGALDSSFTYLVFFGFEVSREEIFALVALWIFLIIVLIYC